jgi:hypothetical protein
VPPPRLPPVSPTFFHFTSKLLHPVPTPRTGREGHRRGGDASRWAKMASSMDVSPVAAPPPRAGAGGRPLGCTPVSHTKRMREEDDEYYENIVGQQLSRQKTMSPRTPFDSPRRPPNSRDRAVPLSGGAMCTTPMAGFLVESATQQAKTLGIRWGMHQRLGGRSCAGGQRNSCLPRSITPSRPPAIRI